MGNISENLKNVMENITAAAYNSGREPQDIITVAVSKTRGSEIINEAYDSGVVHFGENKAQELCEKYDYTYNNIKWHFVGHLQSNKVKYIIDKVILIHSLDRISLAKEINKQSQKINTPQDVLVQVNVAEEDSKFGIAPEKAESFIKEVNSNLQFINIRGLMTIAPFYDNPEDTRMVFRGLKNLQRELREKIPGVDLGYLSMGMTNDYKVAIEEGANIVRIGTAIFGHRNY